MTISFYSVPKQRITVTHGGKDYQFEDQAVNTVVTRRENSASYAVIKATDTDSASFLDECDITDNVKIEFKYADGSDSYTQVFGGWISEIVPSLTEQGELITITALGYGVALRNMVVRQEYGDQSNNPGEKTLVDVLTDATIGIIPQYVNKVLATATDSGYSIDTTEVASLTTVDFRYLYFAGKPASKCLEDALDLYRAAKVPDAGAHWIIVPDGTTPYLCVGTVGAHEAAITDKWPTWYDTDAANSTLEAKTSNIVTSFHKTRAEANYILYSGNYRFPGNGDLWTENNSGNWDTQGANAPTLADDSDAADVVVGSYSLRADFSGGKAGWWFYPGTHDAAVDLTKIETPTSVPFLSFNIKRSTNILLAGAPGVPFLALGTGDPAAGLNEYYVTLNTVLNSVAADRWVEVALPIGNYHDMANTNDSFFYSSSSSKFAWIDGGGDWSDIDWVGFWFMDNGAAGTVHIDGLHFGGRVTRGAYDSTKIASQKCRILTINDDVPKDDTLQATDDSGEIAQYAKAELARAARINIVGEIVVPLIETLLPGQKMHIHHCKKRDGSFRVDSDMRVIQLVHSFQKTGATTNISLTDDTKNSYVSHPSDAYNLLYKAVAPAFQDRMRSSLITKEIDLTQTILSTDYNTATWD
jgi:hypothetical protein